MPGYSALVCPGIRNTQSCNDTFPGRSPGQDNRKAEAGNEKVVAGEQCDPHQTEPSGSGFLEPLLDPSAPSTG